MAITTPRISFEQYKTEIRPRIMTYLSAKNKLESMNEEYDYLKGILDRAKLIPFYFIGRELKSITNKGVKYDRNGNRIGTIFEYHWVNRFYTGYDLVTNEEIDGSKLPSVPEDMKTILNRQALVYACSYQNMNEFNGRNNLNMFVNVNKFLGDNADPNYAKFVLMQEDPNIQNIEGNDPIYKFTQPRIMNFFDDIRTTGDYVWKLGGRVRPTDGYKYSLITLPSVLGNMMYDYGNMFYESYQYINSRSGGFSIREGAFQKNAGRLPLPARLVSNNPVTKQLYQDNDYGVYALLKYLDGKRRSVGTSLEVAKNSLFDKIAELSGDRPSEEREVFVPVETPTITNNSTLQVSTLESYIYFCEQRDWSVFTGEVSIASINKFINQILIADLDDRVNSLITELEASRDGYTSENWIPESAENINSRRTNSGIAAVPYKVPFFRGSHQTGEVNIDANVQPVIKLIGMIARHYVNFRAVKAKFSKTGEIKNVTGEVYLDYKVNQAAQLNQLSENENEAGKFLYAQAERILDLYTDTTSSYNNRTANTVQQVLHEIEVDGLNISQAKVLELLDNDKEVKGMNLIKAFAKMLRRIRWLSEHDSTKLVDSIPDTSNQGTSATINQPTTENNTAAD